MDRDGAPVGRLLTRRELLALVGVSGAALAAGAAFLWPRRPRAAEAFPSCVARPEQTEGPYFVDERLNRSDIRSDPTSGAVSAGVPLALTFLVSRITRGSCEPLPAAQVDLWQCDAAGVYSDVADPGFDTVGQKFLRGYQLTDAQGQAVFRTVYPGWYAGRTVHLHFKVRVPASATNAAEFTSQLYFDDALTDRVHALPPYSAKGQRNRRNRDDGIFRRGGDQLLLAPQAVGEGYEASFSLGLQLDD
ncbi:MAG: intradiol ring-cleavage dioxygenase [Longimicrobiales bacterium]